MTASTWKHLILRSVKISIVCLLAVVQAQVFHIGSGQTDHWRNSARGVSFPTTLGALLLGVWHALPLHCSSSDQPEASSSDNSVPCPDVGQNNPDLHQVESPPKWPGLFWDDLCVLVWPQAMRRPRPFGQVGHSGPQPVHSWSAMEYSDRSPNVLSYSCNCCWGLNLGLSAWKADALPLSHGSYLQQLFQFWGRKRMKFSNRHNNNSTLTTELLHSKPLILSLSLQ